MKPLLAVVALLLLVGGGWYWYVTHPVLGDASAIAREAQNSTSSTASAATDTGAAAPDANAATSTNSAVVLHTQSGFAPASVTIKVGGSVTWTDADGSGMWVASNQHPSHTEYDGTSRTQHCAPGTTPAPFDECAAGTRYTFTFTKAGTWTYHNHMSPNQTGTVVVAQ